MNTAPSPKTKAFYFLMLILGSLTAVGPLTVDMYLPSFPIMADSFGVPISRIQLSLTAYFIGMMIGQAFYGPLSDRFGRKKPLYFGLVIYILASLGCATADGVDVFIFYRFVQALGGCAGMVIARSIVRDLFDYRQVAQVFSHLMLVMGLAPILAPMAGAWLLTVASWQMIFFSLTGFSMLTLILAALFLPETQGTNPKIKLSRTFHTYWDLLKQPHFLGYTLMGSFNKGALFAYLTGSSYIFIEYFGLSPQRFGLLFGINAMGFVIVSQFNGLLLARIDRPEKILKVSVPLFVLASFVLMVMGILDLGFYSIVIPTFFLVALFGVIFPNVIACALQHEKHRSGAASSLMGVGAGFLSVIASAAISYFHTEGPLSFALVIGTCGIATLFAFRFVSGNDRRAEEAMVAKNAEITDPCPSNA